MRLMGPKKLRRRFTGLLIRLKYLPSGKDLSRGTVVQSRPDA